jgi:Kdo2-lipid IVA lauroyltransferase/acyltransferase
MMNYLLYYLLIYPVSKLPFFILYKISDFIYYPLYYIFKYRRDVVRMNLTNSFPDKSLQEIIIIEKKYYQHMADLLIEGVKNFTISKEQLKKRYIIKNPELVNNLNEKGISTILNGGHYNNWEYLILAMPLYFTGLPLGVGKPLSNKGFGAYLENSRSRFGSEMIPTNNIKKFNQYLNEGKVLNFGLLNDQSPGNPKKSYWMHFLNQITPIIYGPEIIAKRNNLPVFYMSSQKVKRGYYEMTLKTISKTPKEEAFGDIIFKSAQFLEEDIINQPENWLWSHKRWKHKPIESTEVRAV